MPRLDAASQAHLEAFQRFKIKHPHLEEMDRLLSEAIAEHTSYNLLALYGPSGVGKSTVIRRIADRMREINNHTAAVAASVQQQNAATGEITQNVASAAQGTKEIVLVLGDVAGAATETRGSAETVLAASQAVETAAAELRSEVEGFLQKVAI